MVLKAILKVDDFLVWLIQKVFKYGKELCTAVTLNKNYTRYNSSRFIKTELFIFVKVKLTFVLNLVGSLV
jgi:hypothetical protein